MCVVPYLQLVLQQANLWFINLQSAQSESLPVCSVTVLLAVKIKYDSKFPPTFLHNEQECQS